MKTFLMLLVFYTGFALTFGMNGFLTHNLGLAGLGDFQVGLAVANILGVIVMLGGDQVALRMVPQYANEQKWDYVNGLLRHYVKQSALLSIGIGLIAGAVIAGLVHFKLIEQLHAAVTAALLTPLIAFTLLFSCTLQSFGRPVAALSPGKIVKPLAVWAGGTLWLLLFSAFTEYHAILVLAFTLILVAAIQWITITFSLPSSLYKQASFDIATWRIVGFPLLLTALADALVRPVFTITLEILDSSEDAVGIFALLMFLCSPCWMNFNAVKSVITPKIAASNGSTAILQTLFNRSFTSLLLCNLAFVVVATAFVNPILAWFHADLLNYKGLFFTLLIMSAVNTAMFIATPFISLGGYQKITARFDWSLLILILVCLPIAIIVSDVKGAVLLSISVYLIQGLCYCRMLQKYFGVNPWLALNPKSLFSIKCAGVER